MTPITLKKILAALPLPATGVTLAFAALGLLFQNCFCNLLPSPPAAAILYAVCGTIAAGIWLLLILKILFCFPEIREAMRNPLSASVSGTFPMATMLLAVYLEPLASGAAAVLWFAAVGLHAALIIFFTVRFMFPPKLGQIFPS
ncbi:MAG: hypothetical protein Q4Q04_06115, partial [Methanocorpusculum sp.]|nr:hypothetical protein [Methanocorpusculum sp.]